MPRCLVALFLFGTLGACATPGTKADLLNTTLESYASIIRWGNFEEAVGFVDPERLKEHPITKLDLDRYLQVRVSTYTDQPVRPIGDKEAHQTVEIGLVNNNTQSVRSIIDRQVWRYDDKAKRWWLETGLPDITAH